MAKSLSSQAVKANNRVIEGKAGAVAHGKKGKESVPAPSAIVIKTGIGTTIGECIAAVYGKPMQSLREAIQALGKESVETRKQALKELTTHQYKAQCKAAGIEYVKGMEPSEFMASKGTAVFHQQRSLAANYSRAKRIVKALVDGFNVKAICESKNISEMSGLADRSGGERKNKKPMGKGEFQRWCEKLALVCVDHTNETQVHNLETLVLQALKLAEAHSIALSDDVKKAIGLPVAKARNLRRVA